MDIPHYSLPLRLRAWHWVFLNRALWMAGLPGPFESFRAAKRRCQAAARHLDALATTYENLAVFGHGFSNLFIGRSLLALGWRGVARPLKYWEVNWLAR
jgi:broad specificity phosphatase PhoE